MKSLFPVLIVAALLTVALAQPSTPATAPVPPPAAITAATTASASPGPRRIDLPPETGTYRPGPGVELAQAFCLNCHSTEYSEFQPPLPDTYWQGTVKKMKEKFGATLPDEAIAPLTQYLIGAYGNKTK